jgi:NAD(P)-dependent dehydrogenase (short-subunit alcohol dehydrogenase family)
MGVIVVTGAGSGIGTSIARTLAARGHTVIVTARGLAAAEVVASDIASTGGSAIPMALDVTDREAAMGLALEIFGEQGTLDGWVNNAGVSTMTPFLDVSAGQLAETMDVNVKGVFYCGQAAGRVMREQGHGRIVNISSMAGKMGGVLYLADYVASKFATIGLSRAMAAELAKYSITVNSVCPGYVSTPMQQREIAWEAKLNGLTPKQVGEGYIAATPLGRISIPEDVAKVVAFLLSDDAEFITGESISVNGGAYMD